MYQAWLDLAFLHWRFAPEQVRPLVPPQLELDLWEDAAWVGLVPFSIEGRSRLSSFLETNVRTYVVDRKGGRGVWFFSLDAASLTAVMGARAAYALPYFWARMELERQGAAVRYRSRRVGAAGTGCDIALEVGEAIPDPGELDLFLTARYRLYALRLGRLMQAGVVHPPWPLQRARAVHLRQNLLEAAGLPQPQGEPIAHFSARVEVAIGRPSVVS